MSKRIIKAVRCDGCGRDTYDYDIEIVVSRAKYEYVPPEENDTLDLCAECYHGRGLFICLCCKSVHIDANCAMG